MVALTAKFTVKPGHAETVESALKQMAVAVKETEPGCLDYKVNRSVDDSNVFLLYERYEDRGAVEAHRQTQHYVDLVQGVIGPLLEEKVLEFFTFVTG